MNARIFQLVRVLKTGPIMYTADFSRRKRLIAILAGKIPIAVVIMLYVPLATLFRVCSKRVASDIQQNKGLVHV